MRKAKKGYWVVETESVRLTSPRATSSPWPTPPLAEARFRWS